MLDSVCENCRLSNLECGPKFSAKEYKDKLAMEQVQEEARRVAEQTQGFDLRDRSPRSRQVFETVIEITAMELEAQGANRLEAAPAIRNIAHALANRANALDPQRQMMPIPTQEGGLFGASMEAFRAGIQPQAPSMERIQSAPYQMTTMTSMPQAMPFPHYADDVSVHPMAQQFQPPQQGPTAPLVPQQPQTQGHQTSWEWPWNQLSGNINTVYLI
jgi:hypothetical protein